MPIRKINKVQHAPLRHIWATTSRPRSNDLALRWLINVQLHFTPIASAVDPVVQEVAYSAILSKDVISQCGNKANQNLLKSKYWHQ